MAATKRTLRIIALACGFSGTALAVWALFDGRVLIPAIFLILLAGSLGAMSRDK